MIAPWTTPALEAAIKAEERAILDLADVRAENEARLHLACVVRDDARRHVSRLRLEAIKAHMEALPPVKVRVSQRKQGLNADGNGFSYGPLRTRTMMARILEVTGEDVDEPWVTMPILFTLVSGVMIRWQPGKGPGRWECPPKTWLEVLS